MKSRFNIILAVLLAVQVAIILLFNQPWSSKYVNAGTDGRSPLFPEFDKSRAASFEVTSSDCHVRLERREGDWYVLASDKAFPAWRFAVDELLDALQIAVDADIISDDEEKWSNYGVDDEQGYRLEVWDEGKTKVVDAVLGKNVGSMKGTYLRRKDQKGVMLVMTDLKSCVKKGDNWYFAWRDRMIHKDKRHKEMVSLIIDGPYGRVEIERRPGPEGEPDIWYMTKPFEGIVFVDNINHMMSTVTHLNATGFAPPDTKIEDVGLDNPRLTVTLGKSDGENVVFKFTKETEEKKFRYVTVSTQPDAIFKLLHPYVPFFGMDPAKLLKKENPDGDGK